MKSAVDNSELQTGTVATCVKGNWSRTLWDPDGSQCLHYRLKFVVSNKQSGTALNMSWPRHKCFNDNGDKGKQGNPLKGEVKQFQFPPKKKKFARRDPVFPQYPFKWMLEKMTDFKLLCTVLVSVAYPEWFIPDLDWNLIILSSGLNFDYSEFRIRIQAKVLDPRRSGSGSNPWYLSICENCK